MRQKLFSLIIGLGLSGVVGGLTGCISALPPKVEVVGAQVVEQSPEGARLEIALVLTNPNDVSLPLPEATYTVSVPGVGSFDAFDLPAKILPAGGTQSVTLPVAIRTQGVDLAGRTWRANGTVTYDPDNGIRRFLTETGAPLPIAFFGGEGTLE
ncbi:MAG: hypothetical protein AAF333_07405 [Planctomycetota bacterium]